MFYINIDNTKPDTGFYNGVCWRMSSKHADPLVPGQRTETSWVNEG